MSASTFHESEMQGEELYRPYRPVSKAAVASLLLGILSILVFAGKPMLVLPFAGFFCGLVGLRAIRRYPDEYSGRIAAWIGVVSCLLFFLSGASFHAIVYATEVPDGYQRISFADLQPSKDQPNLAISPKAFELDGKRVFIKGYVFPGGQQYDIKRFVMVPDMGTCCFGGQPKLTDMVEVILEDPLRVDFARRKRKFAGVFHLNKELRQVGKAGMVAYRLEADYVR
jgi:hypothetical protein